jgi:hypothetical protein
MEGETPVREMPDEDGPCTVTVSADWLRAEIYALDVRRLQLIADLNKTDGAIEVLRHLVAMTCD